MPTRFIKESCRTSKNLQLVQDFSERLFWRLLTTADDYGRCMAAPAVVRANCFPLSDNLSLKKIESALVDLVKHRLITRYSVGEREYAEFSTFTIHQGNPRAKVSKYPSVNDVSASRCPQVHADALGHPDTDTDTDTKAISSLNSPVPDLQSKIHSIPKRIIRSISDDDKPTEKHRGLAAELKIDLSPEWAKFKNYCLAHDKRYANFEAAFRNWLVNAHDMKGAKRA